MFHTSRTMIKIRFHTRKTSDKSQITPFLYRYPHSLIPRWFQIPILSVLFSPSLPPPLHHPSSKHIGNCTICWSLKLVTSLPSCFLLSLECYVIICVYDKLLHVFPLPIQMQVLLTFI